MRRRSGLWALVLLVLVGAASATALGLHQHASSAPSKPVTRVEAWGDSMLYQDGPDLGRALRKHRGLQFDFHAFPGTPLCSWLNPKLANGIPAVVARRHPEAVVLQFGGAGSSPCAKGWPPVRASVDEYHGEGLTRVAAAFVGASRYLLDHGVERIEVVGLPLRAPVMRTLLPRDAAMREALRRAVAEVNDPRVRYLNLVPALADARGHFAVTAPCSVQERRTPGHCTGPAIHGLPSNYLRADDGLHLCNVTWPESGAWPGPGCPGYSAGSYRAARAIATPWLVGKGS